MSITPYVGGSTSRPNNKDQSKMIWMDLLKPNPRKIPGLGPIVSYTTGANRVFIKKDQGKAIWKDVLKPILKTNSRKTICNIV